MQGKKILRVGFPPLEDFKKNLYLNPMQLALEYKKCITDEQMDSQTKLAKKFGVSRTRITQILNLLKLAPEIQQYILTQNNLNITEKKLRALTQIKDKKLQSSKFQELLHNLQHK
ncbi:MAG: hypothetical protein PHX21_05680 [bacterium]|nr:hypothetical protein [bacterium]